MNRAELALLRDKAQAALDSRRTSLLYDEHWPRMVVELVNEIEKQSPIKITSKTSISGGNYGL